MIKKTFLLQLLYAFLIPVALSRNYDFRNYSNESGLSHNTVYCCLQDSRNFMWFGTKDGLNRFDGHVFKIYRHRAGDRTSIKHNYINCLYEDKDGLIWIGTDKGLCYYDVRSDLFYDLDDILDYQGDIADIKEDFKENIWIQSYGGLYRYNKKKKTIKYYPASEYFSPHHLCITGSGDLWITAFGGYLYKYDYRNDEFIKYEILNDRERIGYTGRSPIIDAGIYGLLIGTEEKGIKHFDPASKTMETLFETDKEGNPIYARVILRYSEDEYWIGSESGIHICNLKTKQLTGLRKKSYNPYSLADNAIYSLTKDSEGGVWAGTYFRGINYLPPEYTPFEKIFNQGFPDDIKGSVIREICRDEKGNLWIGTEDHGLNKLDPKTKKFINFIPDNQPGSLKSSNIHGLLTDKDKLWIGYFNMGIDILDMNKGKVIRHYSAENGGINTKFVIKIFKTAKGEILIGTLGGIFRYDPDSDTFTFDNELAAYSFVYCICEDHEGTMWVGTLSSGLYYKTKTGETGVFRYNEMDESSISSDAVTDIFEDSENRIWLGTRGNGLCEFDPKTKKFFRYTMEKGFPSNFVYKILEDSKGNLWISTSNGLLCFNPNTKAMKRYSKSNGITNNQFNYNSGFKDGYGRMYFGSIDGMITFIPEKIKENEFIPPVYITGFRLFNEELKQVDDSLRNQSVLFADKIVLPHEKSTFSIEFAALSYVSPETNEYMYKLEGSDTDWIHQKTYNKAHYTNLPPGKYTFRLKAANGDGRWNQTEKTIDITVKAPFWRTPWAYGVYFLLIACMAFFMLSFYTQRIRLKNNLKFEKMEALKEKELFNAKIDFFTQIAHEIRTPLTLIKGSLDRIIRSENKTESIKENLPVMDKNTDRLLNLSNQLLDFRKTEKEGMRLNFVRAGINELLNETYFRFTPIAEEKGIVFNLMLIDPNYEAAVDKEALTKILSNLFSNALKFAEKEVLVRAEANEKTSTFIIRVNNDGKIIPEEMKEKIFEPFFQYKETHNNASAPKGAGIGLFLARSLCELHNGRLYLDKSMKDINSFVVELPKMQDICITLKEEEPLDEDTEKNPESVVDNNLPQVLVVEDEPEMLNFVAEELSENYHVLKAKNGNEALKIIDSHMINIIVSDIAMPGLDGFELCKIIKSDLRYSHIPFILLSAKHALQSKIQGLESGADAYIGKPFSTDYLRAQLFNLLKSRAQLIESFNKSPFLYSNTIASTKADESFLDTLNEIILEKLSDPDLSVDCLAATLRISTSSLYRKVKGISNTNPNEFIRIIRLKKAAELLLNENLSIKEVSYITGFSSPSYFTASFFKQFGLKPSEFVKKHVKKNG